MRKHPCRASGNILFMILIAIVLTGLLTVAIQSSTQTGDENIDRETLIIRAAEVRQYAAELENAVGFIFQNDISETAVSFAHPDANADYGTLGTSPNAEIFNRNGGAANFKAPPSGITTSTAWEFYGGTAMPGVGSDRAELIAVLPNVTQEFCEFINGQIGYTGQPQDTSTCVNEGAAGRFDNATKFNASPNTVDVGTFSQTPAQRACIQCTADGSYHYVHVLMSR